MLEAAFKIRGGAASTWEKFRFQFDVPCFFLPFHQERDRGTESETYLKSKSCHSLSRALQVPKTWEQSHKRPRGIKRVNNIFNDVLSSRAVQKVKRGTYNVKYLHEGIIEIL